MQQAEARLVRRVLKVQAILGAVAVASALPFGRSVALSALIGAGSCLLANALFAASVLRGYHAQQPERILMRFYGGELAKILLILAVFAIAFAMFEGLNVPVLLGSYLISQMASPLIAARAGDRPSSGPSVEAKSER